MIQQDEHIGTGAAQSCPGEFQVVQYDVPEIVGDYQCLDYRDPHHPRIVQLREEYGLEEVVAGCATEFEEILALKRWVRSRWDHGYSRNVPDIADGLGLLQAAARGEQFSCGKYATVLIDAAAALGLPARQVSLSIRECQAPRDFHILNLGHSVVEVWSNAFRKWILMDADVNVHYGRNGVPLNVFSDI